MPRNRIPERDPVGYAFTGSLIQVQGFDLLTLNPTEDVQVIATGELTIRYGIRYLGKPHLSIVPGIVALDYGDMLTGEEAWNFLFNKSNLHPRADVVGYRHDGQDEMIVVKALDLAMSPAVLVYPDDKATTPIGNVEALIATQTAIDNADLPPNLLKYLTHYETIANWQAENA